MAAVACLPNNYFFCLSLGIQKYCSKLREKPEVLGNEGDAK